MNATRPFSDIEASMSPEAIAASDRLYLKDRLDMLISMMGHLLDLPPKEMATILDVPLADLIDVEYQGDMSVNEVRRLIAELDVDVEISLSVGGRKCSITNTPQPVGRLDADPPREQAA